MEPGTVSLDFQPGANLTISQVYDIIMQRYEDLKIFEFKVGKQFLFMTFLFFFISKLFFRVKDFLI